MAEQWIDAATAFRLVAGVTNPPSLADVALCRRAREGLIRARARVLVVGDRRSEDDLVPAEFWSTGQRAGLAQNWAAGDFSGKTGSLGTDRWQAFDVTFALSGVLDFLPFEQRAVPLAVYRSPGSRIGCPRARQFSLACKAPGITSGPAAILEHARLGFVAGKAVLAQRFKHRGSSELLWEEREWNIPDWFWESCARAGESFQDWALGNLHGGGRPFEQLRMDEAERGPFLGRVAPGPASEDRAAPLG